MTSGVTIDSALRARAATSPSVVVRVATRIGAVVAVLGAATLFTAASHAAATAQLASVLAKYSPARLTDGRVWTVPLSVLLLGHPRMLGPTTVFVVAVFLPYTLWRGMGRAAMTAMAGHVVSTLVVAVVVIPAAALGVAGAAGIARTPDYGASAALAACAGGLAVAVARRLPVAGAVVFVGVAAWFAHHLATVGNPAANVADVEHLVALGCGALVEWSLIMRTRPAPIIVDDGA